MKRLEHLGCNNSYERGRRMAKNRIMVPFGYEPYEDGIKGTLFVISDFEMTTYVDIHRILELADNRSFDKIILYPLHEQTLKRMTGDGYRPYFKRVKYLESILEEFKTDISVTIDQFEGKRKKYTPIETSIKFLMEKYKKPYFLYVTGEYANKIASYHTFEQWIKDVKLIIPFDAEFQPNSMLNKYKNRWEII